MNSEQISYSHCNSVLTDNRIYRIGGNALIWQDDNEPEVSLPYHDIQSIEACFSPSRVQANRYMIRMKTRSKGKIDITNTSYKGIGDFEELNETYVPFVRELHRKITEVNPAVQFKQGSSWGGYIFAILVTMVLVLVIIGAGMFFLAVGMVWIAAIKLAVLLFFFPRLIRYVKRSKPGSYDPLNLPDEIMPALSESAG